jgi:hypothetical protein
MWKERFIELEFPLKGSELKIEEAMQLKFANLPPFLYKYRSFDVDGYSLQNFENDQIWITNAANYNDPYDCALTLDVNPSLDMLTKGLIEQYLKGVGNIQIQKEEIEGLGEGRTAYIELMKLVAGKDPEFSKQIGDDKDKFAETMALAITKLNEKQVQKFMEHSQSGIFIACFSEIKDSILMWSHYAASHTGFCIEYDFAQLGPQDVLTRLLYPVLYTDKMFDMAKYVFPEDRSDFNNLFLTYAAITKSLEWSYEKEWRLVFPMGPSFESFNRWVPKPTGVYLGAKISQENREKVIRIAEKKEIPVYQMKMESSQFKLTANPV